MAPITREHEDPIVFYVRVYSHNILQGCPVLSHCFDTWGIRTKRDYLGQQPMVVHSHVEKEEIPHI